VEQAKKAANEHNNSEVYKKIFGDGSAKKDHKDNASKLFISTAAPRYTIS